MRRNIWAVLVIAAPLLAGCGSLFDGEQAYYSQMPGMTGHSMVADTGQAPLQCVPFARDHSKVKIFGDAWTWWDKAAGKFARAQAPSSGAILVLADYAGPDHGHLAVVQKIIGAREIRVDHANWLNDGSVYLNDPVLDVSDDNDWSAVKVFNIQSNAWGSKIYPVKGFILSSPPGSAPPAPAAPAPQTSPGAVPAEAPDGPSQDTLTPEDLVARADIPSYIQEYHGLALLCAIWPPPLAWAAGRNIVPHLRGRPRRDMRQTGRTCCVFF